jgi:predicted metal-dependent peptidase
MTATWVRRDFGGTGVTQYKPGRHLDAVQAHLLGRALLCIDVSGSMSGAPLRAAIDGGGDFLDEAAAAGYRCGLILWDDGVVAHLPTTSTLGAVRNRLNAAAVAGGTALSPALRVAIAELGPMTGDRVVCVFGDGGIGDPGPTAVLAAEARALGIRFVVRGLGAGASTSLTAALKPDGDDSDRTIHDVGDMRRGIASMVRDMTTGRS